MKNPTKQCEMEDLMKERLFYSQEKDIEKNRKKLEKLIAKRRKIYVK